jgi:hypothetical protein
MSDITFATSCSLIIFKKNKEDPNKTKIRVEDMFAKPKVNKRILSIGEHNILDSKNF